jgi:osmotically-inducible protein OsmY
MLLEERVDFDHRLTGAIRRRLSVVTVLDADDVDVVVEYGHVVLSGSVETFSERLMCAEVAQSLAASGAVQNELIVRHVEVGCGSMNL